MAQKRWIGNGNSEMKKKIVLYTAAFGSRLRFKIPEVSDMSVDRFCYSDIPRDTGGFYDFRKLKISQPSSVRRQRFVKIIIPDELFDNYEYSVYVDCKRPYSVDYEHLLSCLEPNSDILTRAHRKRNCLYDEGRFCILKKKDSAATIQRQLDYYKKERCPWNLGLHASGILLRRHTERLREFSYFWWNQIEIFSHRDQISLPYAAWKTDMKISICERRRQ